MKARVRSLRPRPRSLRSGAFFVLTACAALLAPVGATADRGSIRAAVAILAAQDTVPLAPQPPDTLTQDTVPGDTLGPPPPILPALDPLGPASWARGVWEWDRLALRRLPDLSLVHLLERLPGVVPVRADVVNQAESAAILGATAGGIRYVLDGFELDPLVAPTFDPSRIPLLALERVRVERGVTGATVHLETLSPDHPQPRSIVEAGTGDFGVNLFRGMFLGPSVLGGPLGLGFERLASGGAIPGSSNHVAGWIKWSWVRDASGIQIEFRQSTMDRSGVAAGLDGTRRDWVVRARTARGPLTGEVYAGASAVEEERGEALVREGTPQGGLRLRGAWDAPVPLEARTAFRLRDHPRLPSGELELGVRAFPLPLLAVEAEAVQGWWDEGPATGRWLARAQAGPVVGMSAFGEVFRGSPLLGDGPTLRVPSPHDASLQVTRDGLRAGAELRYRDVSLAAAAIRTTADTVPAFGLPTEGTLPRPAGGEATGLELIVHLPTGWDPLTVQGWYVGMNRPAGWLYLPEHHWRAGLVYHHFPLPSGNLELFARAEHRFRGRMTVPATAEPEPGPLPGLTEVGSMRTTNLELSIRVLTVRAFFRWDNMLNRRPQQDLPAFTHPGQHVLYGVKWEFLN